MKVIYKIRDEEIVIDDVVRIQEVTSVNDTGYFIWRYKEKENEYTYVAADLVISIEMNGSNNNNAIDVYLGENSKHALCPKCKNPFLSSLGYVKYCCHCGQHVSWRSFWKVKYPNLVDENGDLINGYL